MPWIDLTASIEVNTLHGGGSRSELVLPTKNPGQQIKISLYASQVMFRCDATSVNFELLLKYKIVPHEACPPPTIRFATFWLFDGTQNTHTRFLHSINTDRLMDVVIPVGRQHLAEATASFKAAAENASKKFIIYAHVHALFECELLPKSQTENARALYGLGAFRGGVFEKDSITNFVIQSGQREFHVHRGILAARSEYFARMLDAGMTEQSEQRMSFDFCGSDIAEKFLMKVYDPAHIITSDSVQEVAALMKVFHMYEMQPEVQQCRELLLELFAELGRFSPTIPDICVLLEVGKLYGFDDIFNRAVLSIRVMRDDVWENPEFQNLINTNHEVLTGLARAGCGEF